MQVMLIAKSISLATGEIINENLFYFTYGTGKFRCFLQSNCRYKSIAKQKFSRVIPVGSFSFSSFFK